MMRIFKRMNELCPGHVHVNGIEHNAWFKVANFSVEALTAQQQIVPLHSYPYWSEAIKHTKPLEQPYIELPAALAALQRAYGKAPRKPIWMQEFGASSIQPIICHESSTPVRRFICRDYLPVRPQSHWASTDLSGRPFRQARS